MSQARTFSFLFAGSVFGTTSGTWLELSRPVLSWFSSDFDGYNLTRSPLLVCCGGRGWGILGILQGGGGANLLTYLTISVNLNCPLAAISL